MTRRVLCTSLLSALLITPSIFAQNPAAPMQAQAAPTMPTQKVLIHVHSNDPKQVEAAVAKANELMASSKTGSTMVEILATGDGLKLVNRQENLSAHVNGSIDKDVSFVACHASMKSKNMTVDQLQNGVGIVPSGSKEIALRKADGWTVLDDKMMQ